MARITKSSTIFKIFEVAEDARRQDDRRVLRGQTEIRGTSLEQSFSDLDTENRSSRINRFPCRPKPNDSREPTTSTTTPETSKVLLPLPNAPVKPPRKPKNIDMRPKRLQFMEESENPSTMDSPMDRNDAARRYPTRSSSARCKISENSAQMGFKEKNVGPERLLNSKKNLRDIDKENDGSLANDRNVVGTFGQTNRVSSKNINSRKNSSKQKSSSENRFKSEELDADNRKRSSQSDDDCEWKDTLKWLHPRRDIGLWIQCCRENCRKWRYNEKFHDPTDVPELWYCYMDPNPLFASCDKPEEEIPSDISKDVIHNEYNAGSIVWAKLLGYPWWPAMVDDSPSTFLYYQLEKNSSVPITYNVTYFGIEPAQQSWIPVKDLRPFATNPKDTFLKRKRMTYDGVCYKDRVSRACELAAEALPMSISERLSRFSFAVRYDSGSNNEEHDIEQSVIDDDSQGTYSQRRVDGAMENQGHIDPVSDDEEPDKKKMLTTQSPDRSIAFPVYNNIDKIEKVDDDENWPLPPNATSFNLDVLLRICSKHEKPFV